MTRVGSVYAQALYDLAGDEGFSEVILEELKVLNGIFTENADYLRLLSTPNLAKDERCRILDEGFSGRIHPYVLNFLKILTEKGYVRHFGDCCEAYRQLYNEEKGIMPVKVITAVPLNDDQKKRLGDKLNAITGKKVELENKIDPMCIGGIMIDYDGKRVDDTVRHRLDAVRSLLKNTML